MAKVKGATAGEYPGKVPAEPQPRARAPHRALCESLPNARVQVKWGQPAFVDDTILVSYAVYAKHINLCTTPGSREALAGELAGYTLGKGSIQLPHDEPLPIDLIKLVATAREKEFREQHVRWRSWPAPMQVQCHGSPATVSPNPWLPTRDRCAGRCPRRACSCPRQRPAAGLGPVRGPKRGAPQWPWARRQGARR